MSRLAAAALLAAAFAAATGAVPVSPASASGPDAGVTVTYPVAAAVGSPLSSRRPTADLDMLDQQQRTLPLLPGSGTSASTSTSTTDPAQQTTTTASATATTLLSFRGGSVGDAGVSKVAPPDTTGAAGTDGHYVQWVNLSLSVFDATTGSLVNLGSMPNPMPGNTLWGPMGGPCASTNSGDPVVTFDKSAQRWVLTQFALPSGAYYQCVAVSSGNDFATSSWNLYAYKFKSMNDYPKLGVRDNAYYFSFNMFKGGRIFLGPQVCALDKASIVDNIAATSPPLVCKQLSSSVGTLIPADDETTPNPNEPGVFLTMSSGGLDMYTLTYQPAKPSSSSLSALQTVPVPAYSRACGGGTCIPQPNTGQQLDSLADRLMFRLAAHPLPGGGDTLLITHAVTPNGGAASGIRWYVLQRPSSGTPTYSQASTYSPDSVSRWMSSAAMNTKGDIAVGYSLSDGSSIKPSVAIAARLGSEQASTLGPEQIMQPGVGSQTGGLSRWGDYSAMTLAPDGCTFWYTTEWLPGDGAWNWTTSVFHVSLYQNSTAC